MNSEDCDAIDVVAYIPPTLRELGSVEELTLGAIPDITEDASEIGFVS